MWCMWSSPLTLSFDLRKPIAEDDLAIMTNPELIAINQDPMGQQAEFIGKMPMECSFISRTWQMAMWQWQSLIWEIKHRSIS